MTMDFFSSFSALGYSAINLVMVFAVFTAVIWHLLKMSKRHIVAKLVLLAVIGIGFVMATNFLADQNRMLNDAIRQEGGLKRTNTR